MTKKSIYILFIVAFLLLPSVYGIETINDLSTNYTVRCKSDTKKIFLHNHTGCYILTAQSSTDSFQMYCHIPIVFDRQTPLIINDVWTAPVNKVLNYQIVNDYSSLNSLLEVEISSMNMGEDLLLYWSASVIVEEDNYEDLPEEITITPRSELPDKVKKWLLPSEFIQSDHWRIKFRANLLKGRSENVIEIAEKIVDFTANKIRYEGGLQDALTTLKRRCGVCTGKANLAAALFRSMGIPARVLFVYKTHYIVEFFAKPYGWIRVESTAGNIAYPKHDYTVQFLAYNCDEGSDNIINGQNPDGGVIGYWGCSNENVRMNYDYFNEKCKTISYNITSDINTIDDAIDVTRDIWDSYDDLLNTNMEEEDKNHFENATIYQNIAIECFYQNDILGYIENCHQALNEYNHIYNKFKGIAIGSYNITDSSIDDIISFIMDCNINNVIVDFGWITWTWENTEFKSVSNFIDEILAEEIDVWLMYRARTIPGDGYNVPHQVHRTGLKDENEICYSNEKAQNWAIEWSDKLMDLYPKVNGMIIYNPRILPDCCYSYHSIFKFITETKTFGFPNLFIKGTEKYDKWMEWRCDEIQDFINKWNDHIKENYQIKTGAVILPEVYESYLFGHDMSRIESRLDVVFPFVVLDNIDNPYISAEICNDTSNDISCKVIADIKIYGPYENDDVDIVNAIEGLMESKGDGFFIWNYESLDPSKYDISKIINAYNGIYE